MKIRKKDLIASCASCGALYHPSTKVILDGKLTVCQECRKMGMDKLLEEWKKEDNRLLEIKRKHNK